MKCESCSAGKCVGCTWGECECNCAIELPKQRPFVRCGMCRGSGIVADTEYSSKPCPECAGTGEAPPLKRIPFPDLLPHCQDVAGLVYQLGIELAQEPSNCPQIDKVKLLLVDAIKLLKEANGNLRN